MTESKFVYATYIRTTPEKLWQALTQPEFQKSYFFGASLQGDCKYRGQSEIIAASNHVRYTG